MGYRECWTFRTPHGDFEIKENGGGRYEPSFKGENYIGSFSRAEQAYEDLVAYYRPPLPALDEWEFSLVEI
jgi:hypothetical protein